MSIRLFFFIILIHFVWISPDEGNNEKLCGFRFMIMSFKMSLFTSILKCCRTKHLFETSSVWMTLEMLSRSTWGRYYARGETSLWPNKYVLLLSAAPVRGRHSGSSVMIRRLNWHRFYAGCPSWRNPGRLLRHRDKDWVSPWFRASLHPLIAQPSAERPSSSDPPTQASE